MTGTAATEADEFAEIYKLVVVEIPTNLPIVAPRRGRRGLPHVRREDARGRARDRGRQRQDAADAGRHDLDREVRASRPRCSSARATRRSTSPAERPEGALRRGARRQAVEELRRPQRPLPRAGSLHRRRGRRARRDHHRHQHGRPRHRHPARRQRRDARQARRSTRTPRPEERDAQEAAIRAEVAEFKQKAIDAGGLYIIGTERHESRRIDNQLRGRSGRQGDPGRSKFYLSLQDDLMRIFGAERMDAMLKRLGLKEDEAIVHPWINKALEKAQQKVEARNFDIRKNILKFDNVMNDQRKVIFEDRRKMMAQKSLEPTIDDMRTGVIDDLVAKHIPPDAYPEAWDVAGLKQEVARQAQPRPAGRRVGERRRHRRRGSRRAPAQGRRRGLRRARQAQHARGDALCREAGDPADRSTTSGASIWSPSTTCGRSSAGAAWRSATRSTSTSRKRSSSSRS